MDLDPPRDPAGSAGVPLHFDSTEMFEVAFAGAPIGVALIGFDGRFLRVNHALCVMLGRSAEEIVGSTSQPFTHPDDMLATKEAFEHLNREAVPLTVEKRYLRPDGGVVWTSSHGKAASDSDGVSRCIVSHFIDITDIKLAEQRRQEASVQFESVFANAPIGMALVAMDGRVLKVNRTLCELIGQAESQLLALKVQELANPDEIDADLRQVRRLIGWETDRYTSERCYLGAEGAETWVNLSVSLVRDHEGVPLYFIGQIEDVTERKQLQSELQVLADHDPLTELWNRRRFNEELHRQVGRCQRYGEPASLLMIDLDKFKEVNDTHGHGAGDDLLRLIADRMRDVLREGDLVARIGGDEFAVILPNSPRASAEVVAEKLRRLIASTRLLAGGEEIRIVASVGVQPLDESIRDARAAMSGADEAMYRVKAIAAIAAWTGY